MRSESLRSNLGIGVLATAITLLAWTATVAAEPQAECADEVVWTDIVGAERLYWEAMKILEQGEEGEKAALLLGRSALLRVPCDPQTFSLLRMSALLYHRVGNLSEASRTMHRAAEVAVRTRRMLAAAHAYLDYAALLNQLGDVQAAAEAARKAEAISNLPALADWARSTIRDRMQWRNADAFSSPS